MQKINTQVAIIGAGPSGLMLSHLLSLQGVDSVVVESKSRAYCESRIRAGVLEHGTVGMLREAGVAERLEREGMRHSGIELGFGGVRNRIDLEELTGGKCVTVYGQHEVVKDLIARREADNGDVRFECSAVSVHNLSEGSPTVRFEQGGCEWELTADYIGGCDGFHGICRSSIPVGVLTTYDRTYPFAWLGILARAKPNTEELVYQNHERGFALYSMRSPEITRLYLQCEPDEEIAGWSDDRIWDELSVRLSTYDGWRPERGPILQKGRTGMRSFVTEPMQYGKLFLAGDSAHIVPPTGAKGMNLAMADTAVLAAAFARHYAQGQDDALQRYTSVALRRVWKAQRFSWWMTSLLHRFPDQSAFDARRQLAELDYVTSSRAAATTLAENYVGLPMEGLLS